MAAAGKSISGKSAAKILRAARRVEEGDDAAEEDEFAYLGNYNLKMVSCKAGETVINAENGDYEYGAAVLRLCPSSSGCDSTEVTGCDSGYGDIVVSLATFVDAYFEDQRDNMNWDDNFDGDKYAQCDQYDVEDQGDDGQENQYANYAFYIGPACTEEGDDIRLALFEDEVCTYESAVAFEDISNGWSLPYSSGGLVSTSCSDCMEINDDGEYQLREMCQNVYEAAASKCETNMEYVSYYGANEQGCEYISEMLPAKRGGSAGKVFGWIIFVLLIAGVAGYVMWWRKKKSGASDGLVA
eukprot:CAMPEP_0117026114 /NCGR_PEP_ID=MMETSP0472-20121206/19220_1 /TAXON_ID=693140 ORGANISM="Tiarina fusus, Strain LIS" /NCGR_SAMPLE_ID=MMETSP0472 /ASSEMBLY_ACC=CAM_ASM_000603 /LENGTH=297 /DNA_ID=CAMNT_0004733011 /DNA_START=101 /DNA_END=994 /DNA_ORIENTATION=+